VKGFCKYGLYFVLLLITNIATAGQKFKSLEDFSRYTQGHFMIDMAWLEPVTFQGYLDAGSVSSRSSSPMYIDTGVGAAGPAIQLIAQAFGTKHARNRQYSKAQQDADQVLAEHVDKIADLSIEEFYFDFKKIAELKQYSVEVFTPEKKSGDFFIRMEPVFMLSQDMRSVMLRNKVQIHHRKRIRKPIFKQQFVVVSKPIEFENISQFWQQKGDDNLRQLSQNLFKKSIILMLDELSEKHVSESKQKTFRYKFGDTAMFERASLTKSRLQTEHCDRSNVITLGGDIMSLPIPAPECGAPQGN